MIFSKKTQHGSLDSQNIFSCKSYGISEAGLDKEEYFRFIFKLFHYCTNKDDIQPIYPYILIIPNHSKVI